MGIFSRKPRAKQVTWKTPGGEYYNISNCALEAEHTLIAGTTGCGKTTFVRSIMHAALTQYSPADAQFILIDPKRFELVAYSELPHTISYAKTPAQALEALELAGRIMEQRAMELERARRTRYTGPQVYVIIDELNDLMISELSRKIKRAIEHIITLGRALSVHLICCTQNPNRATIPANIVSCYTCRYGLKCMHSIESRQIVGVSGCENLPKHGETIAAIEGSIGRWELPYVTEADIEPLLRYWTSKACIVS